MEPSAAPSPDAQSALRADLLDAVTHGPADLDRVLGLVVDRLAGPCGVRRARLVPAPALVDPDAVVVPLRVLGEPLGLLELTRRPATASRAEPRPDVLADLAHHVAVVVKAEENRRTRRLDADVTDAVRRLFEEGTRAASVREAAEVLARVTADVLRAERVAVHLSAEDTRILDVLDVGVPAGTAAALRAQLVGTRAADSPVWRHAEDTRGPVLADCAAVQPGRPGGFISTMQLRSYAAMPLLSARGPVGMVVCGDVTRARTWTERDRRVARQLALQGALVVDSARLRQAEHEHLAELQHRADHDGLTGLPNRGRLLAALAGALPAAPGAGGALLLIDLDGFKQVNDGFGHLVGDELLRAVARRLRRVLRHDDVAARLGGDEFAVFAAEASAADAGALARRLVEVLSAPVAVEDVTVRVGASIGVALLAEHGDDVPGLLREADARMYEVKRRGRTARADRHPEPAARG